MGGAVVIVLVLLLLPVVVLMVGAVASAVLGVLLDRDARERYAGSELLDVNV
jgi:hypothetical protein